MAKSSFEIPTEQVRDVIVAQVHRSVHDFNLWIARLSDSERMVGLCVFALIVMMLIVRPQRERTKPPNTGREFVFALIIIIIFGFGVGWIFDGSVDMSSIF